MNDVKLSAETLGEGLAFMHWQRALTWVRHTKGVCQEGWECPFCRFYWRNIR